MCNKIQIFGDSVMRGVMYSQEQGKYKLCNDCDFESAKSLGVDVDNHSKMGATVDKGLTVIRKKLTESDDDTLAIIEYGGNDCMYDWTQISANPDGEFQANTPPDVFEREFREAVGIAKQSGARVAVATLLPIDAEKYMNWLSRGLDYRNILKWLGDVSMLSRWQESYSRIVENVAASMNCELIDFRGAFLRRRDFKSLICIDGIHPTQQGHDIIRSTLADYITKRAQISPDIVPVR